MKKVYESELEGPNRGGRPLGRWKDRVDEYLGERGINGRGTLAEARKECWDRKRWKIFCSGHLLRGRLQRERDVRALDRSIHPSIS